MAHMTVSSFAGGAALAPHIAPDKIKINSAYYAESALSPAVFPKIRARVMDAGEWPDTWTRMQDLASAHTAKSTVEFLEKENARTLPRMPKGADCNPLDIYVWSSISSAIKATPKSQRDALPKLKATVINCVEKLRADAAWVKVVKRCCRKRLRWASENEGRQIIGKPWEVEQVE